MLTAINGCLKNSHLKIYNAIANYKSRKVIITVFMIVENRLDELSEQAK